LPSLRSAKRVLRASTTAARDCRRLAISGSSAAALARASRGRFASVAAARRSDKFGTDLMSDSSMEVPHLNAVDPLAYRNLGVLAVAYVAPKGACAVFPAYRVAGPPFRRDPNLDGCGWPCVALACLAWLAAGQSCFT